MAKEGTWSSFMGMWISTFVLSPIAVYLMIKGTRDSSLLDTDWYHGKWLKIKQRLEPVTSRVGGWAASLRRRVRRS